MLFCCTKQPMRLESDNQYQEYEIEHVVPCGDGTYVVSFGDDLTLWTRKNNPIEPKSGMIARVYGENIEEHTRGLIIEGETFWYYSKEDYPQALKEMREEADKELLEDYQKHRIELEEAYEALPDIFKKRIQRFRENNKDFHWKYEPQEIFVAQEALYIDDSFDSSAEIVFFFNDATTSSIFERLPDIDRNHTLHTLAVATKFAILYKEGEDDAILSEPGLLSDIVGLEEYGEIPATEDDS